MSNICNNCGKPKEHHKAGLVFVAEEVPCTSFVARPDEPELDTVAVDRLLEDARVFFNKNIEYFSEAAREKDSIKVTAGIAKFAAGQLEKIEAAVFARGYRRGFFDGSKGTTAFNDEVETAYNDWVATGKKTHLDEKG